MYNQENKHDEGKPQYHLVPVSLMTAVAKIREYGVAKYGTNESWREVEPVRYYDACLRHLFASQKEELDEESKMSHLWHAACNIAFLIEKEGEKKA